MSGFPGSVKGKGGELVHVFCFSHPHFFFLLASLYHGLTVDGYGWFPLLYPFFSLFGISVSWGLHLGNGYGGRGAHFLGSLGCLEACS